MLIEALRPDHQDDVLRIFAEGIATGLATFESKAPPWVEWDAEHLPNCRFVAVDGPILGWAALSGVSSRCVYGGVAEVSVYVAAEARGRGVGLALLQALVTASEEAGIWTLQAGIFQENVPSLKIHERAGFRVVGVRERLGSHNGTWRDVVLLERRSKTVG